VGKKQRRSAAKSPVTGDGDATPYWSPLPRPRHTRAEQASILARHLVPLACLCVFGGSVLQFLLLSVFNIAFTIAASPPSGWRCPRARK
jgi:hypothetical protein